VDGARHRRHREESFEFVRRIALVVLRHRWISPVIWVICLAGTIWLFMLVPKTFLPPGDSGVIFGAFIAQEGSSPQQMQAYQDQVDKMLHADPNVVTDFTMTGATGFLAANQGITFTFIGPPDNRKPIALVTAEMMGKLNTIPAS
jgi:multidrug efflux pump subunit AcrB